MKIKTLEAVYTGGGIWIFWGELEDGHYFLTAHEGWTVILTESPEDFDESLYEEWQEAHKVKDLADEELISFQKELLEKIEKNDYNGGALDSYEINYYKWYWDLEEEEAETAAEEEAAEEEPKQVTIREFINLYNAEVEKMFNEMDKEETTAHIYGYNITLEWNGYKVNLGDGATPTNALIPALEEMDSEYGGEM